MNKPRTGLTRWTMLAAIATVAFGRGSLVSGGKLCRNYLISSPGYPRTERTTALPAVLGQRSSPRQPITDMNLLALQCMLLPPWNSEASLEEIKNIWHGASYRAIEKFNVRLADSNESELSRVSMAALKATLLSAEGETAKAASGFARATIDGGGEGRTWRGRRWQR